MAGARNANVQGKSWTVCKVRVSLTSAAGLGMQYREESKQTTAPKVPSAEIQV